MAYTYIRGGILAASFIPYVSAQSRQSNIVPQDLQSGFRGGNVEVQVSYTNTAIDGFRDGTQFEKNAVTQEPTFALGDSSGITPTTLYTIIMVDTTCPNKRTLHYARANFKNNFDITNIATQSDALQAYKAPGAFGETGDNRQYSFLMYVNPQRRQIDSLRLPGEGETFDVKKFQSDNNLPDPQAGVGMIVKLGGTADCGNDTPNTLPENLPTVRPPTSTAVRTSNGNAGPTSATGGATSSAASGPSSTAAGQRPSAPVSTPTPVQSSGRQNGSSSTGAIDRSSGLIAVPSPAPPSDEEGQSGGTTAVVPSAGRPSGSPTISGSVIQQTTNAAPELGAEWLGWAVPVFAAAGIIFW